MCGLAGAFSASDSQPLDRLTLLRMLAAISHRGPDGCGVFFEQSAALGSVRLAVEDVRNGRQPFVSNRGDVVCCYNGEISNHSALRAMLSKRGYVFRTDCDGEVIANLFACGGRKALDDLEGQFAIALWDRRTRTATLARDEFGVLPLFFMARPGRVVFASSIAAFCQLPGLALTIDEHSLMEICTFWVPIGRSTFITEIRSVLPGETITVHEGEWRSA